MPRGLEEWSRCHTFPKFRFAIKKNNISRARISHIYAVTNNRRCGDPASHKENFKCVAAILLIIYRAREYLIQYWNKINTFRLNLLLFSSSFKVTKILNNKMVFSWPLSCGSRHLVTNASINNYIWNGLVCFSRQIPIYIYLYSTKKETQLFPPTCNANFFSNG